MRINFLLKGALVASALALLAPATVTASGFNEVNSSIDARRGPDRHPGRGGGGWDRHPGRPNHPPPPHRPYPRPMPPPPPHYPPRPMPPPSYGVVLQQYIGQSFYGRSILPLRRILNIGPQYNGYRVESVVVRMRANSGYGFTALLINGYRTSEQRVVSNFPTDYMFFPGPYNDNIGSEISSLQVELDGDFYVESVLVRLR